MRIVHEIDSGVSEKVLVYVAVASCGCITAAFCLRDAVLSDIRKLLASGKRVEVREGPIEVRGCICKTEVPR